MKNFCFFYRELPGANPKKAGNGSEKDDLPRYATSEDNTNILNLRKLDFKNHKDMIDNLANGCFTVAVLIDTSNLEEVVASPVIQKFSDITVNISRFVYLYNFQA